MIVLILILILIVLILLATLACLIDVARNVRKLLRKIDQLRVGAFILRGDGHHQLVGRGELVAFSIWCYEDGAWVLLTGCGRPGCPCGPPPDEPGSYPGQVVRKECPPG